MDSLSGSRPQPARKTQPPAAAGFWDRAARDPQQQEISCSRQSRRRCEPQDRSSGHRGRSDGKKAACRGTVHASIKKVTSTSRCRSVFFNAGVQIAAACCRAQRGSASHRFMLGAALLCTSQPAAGSARQSHTQPRPQQHHAQQRQQTTASPPFDPCRPAAHAAACLQLQHDLPGCCHRRERC
jgi:hypothetical protein